jgi:transposase-like protein
MDTGKKRSQRDYTLAFKLAIVDQVEKGELSYKDAQARYGIQGRSTVLVWLRKHGRQDWSQGASIRVQRTCSMTEPLLPLTPEQRIKALEEQLALSNQKAQFFEAVINVLKNGRMTLASARISTYLILFWRNAVANQDWGRESCIIYCTSKQKHCCRWGGTVCSLSCVKRVSWCPASGLITRQRIAIIAFAGTLIC